MSGTSPAMTWQRSRTIRNVIEEAPGWADREPRLSSEISDGTPSCIPEESKGRAGKARKPAKQAGQDRRQVARRKVRPMGLHLRRRQGAGPLRHEGPARRQGREPRRDGELRPAGAAGLHHHHRGLHPLLRQRQEISEGAREAGRRRPRPYREDHRAAVRRRGQSAAGFGALRRAGLDARHDGYGAQPRPQRRHRRGAGEAVRRPALRVQFLPPLHPDVFQRGARHRTP